MYGKDYEYARTRLEGTIVRNAIDNEPLLVHAILNDGNCKVRFLKDMEGETIFDGFWPGGYVRLSDLNLKPVPLGFVNSNGIASYLSRIPMRKDWKQGLRGANCGSTNLRLDRIKAQDFRNCVLGDFPKFKTALEQVQNKPTTRAGNKVIAFHRHWALASCQGKIFLYYKGTSIVGTVIDGQPVLDPSYTHLTEYLKEVV